MVAAFPPSCVQPLQGLPAVLHAFKRSGPTLTFLGAGTDFGAQGIEGDRGVGGAGGVQVDECGEEVQNMGVGTEFRGLLRH